MFPFYNKDRGLIPSLIQPGKSLVPSIAPKPAPKAVSAPVAGPTYTAPTAPVNNTGGGAPTPPPPIIPVTPVHVPTAAEIQAAQNAAKVKQYQSEINPLLDRYNNMFGSLYGRIDSAAADQANTTRSNYGEQRTNLTTDYNVQVPQIDMSYYLSGVGDSSLRLKGQGQAENAYKQAISSVDKNEQNDLAQIGQSRASTHARYAADQAGIDDIRKQVSESTNPDELLTLRNNLMTKIHGLDADSANFDTSEGFRGSLQKAVPTKDLAPIKNTLKTLMEGAAHPALKSQIAQEIINGSGLSDDQKNDLFKQYVKG